MRVAFYCFALAYSAIASGQMNAPGGLGDDDVITQPPTSVRSTTRGVDFIPLIPRHVRRQSAADRTAALEESAVLRLQVFGTLSESNLLEGRLTAELDLKSVSGSPIRIGRTNLQDLEFFADDEPLDVGCNESGALVPLALPKSGVVTASWRKRGARSGLASVFQLALPPAAICTMQLQTDASTVVTSPNALLTSKAISKDSVEWTVRPEKTGQLTISCNRKSEAVVASQDSLSIKGDVRMDGREVLIDWIVKVSAAVPTERLIFHLTQPCQVQNVMVSDLPFKNWTYDAQARRLDIVLPEGRDVSELTVQAIQQQQPQGQIQLPFLSPQPSVADSETLATAPVIRASTVRASIPPTSVLTDVQLVGVDEGTVSYAADGTQTLNLVQFADNASAGLTLAPSRAVIHDTVVAVMDPEALPGIVTVYLKIEAKSGQLGEVHWQVPKAWRVIEVKEIETRLPLLFRMESSSASGASAGLNAYLRNPVAVETPQSLEVTLQSAFSDPGVLLEPPSLSNEEYLRQQDLIVTHDSTFKPSAEVVVSRPENLSWLPEGAVVDAKVFERRRGRSDSEFVNPATETLFATLDYSVARRRDVLDESIRLRLRRRGGLPARIPLSITSGVVFNVSADSFTQPLPILNRTPSAKENWVLELPGTTELPEEISVLLIASRKFQSPMNAAVVVVSGAQQSGGVIQAPSEDAGLDLSLGGEQLAEGEATTYPDKPPTDLMLTETEREPTEQSISGNVFQILSRDHTNEIVVEAAARLHVASLESNGFLRLPVMAGCDVSVVVNGRPCFAIVDSDILTVPLDRRQPTNTIDLYFKTRSVGTITQPLNLVPIRTPALEANIVVFALLPAQTEVEFSDRRHRRRRLRPAESVRALLMSTFPTADDIPLTNEFVSFKTRWNAAMLSSSSAVMIDTNQAASDVSIQLRDTRLDASITIVLALLCGSVWAFFCSFLKFSLKLPALAALIASFLLVVSFYRPDVRGNALLAGTLGYLLLRLLQSVGGLWPWRWERRRKAPLTVTAGIIVTLTVWGAIATAGQAEGRPKVDNVPDEVLVISSQMDVTLESPRLLRGEIRSVVAVRPETSGVLTLPLQNLTLIECFVDGIAVIPRKHGPDRAQVILDPRVADYTESEAEESEAEESEAEESEAEESEAEESEVSDADPVDTEDVPSPKREESLAGWEFRTVTYQVRMVPVFSALINRIAIPYPPSPKLTLTLTDETATLTSPVVAEHPQAVQVEANQWTFDVVHNRKLIELGFRVQDATLTESVSQRCEVTCDVDVAPQSLRLRTTFQMTSGMTGVDRVTIANHPRHRVTAVSSATGESLPWSTADDQLVVQVPPSADGQQVFTVRQSIETSLSLRHILALDRLRIVNGEPADRLTMSVTTTDRFVVESVSWESDQLAATGDVQEAFLVPPFTSILVPAEVRQAVLTLTQRQSSREASIQQVAVVGDDNIAWNGLCRLDVTGRPIYRQVIQMPHDLRVSSFTASSSGVSRLQTWTRMPNAIVATLREPTRGVIEFRVQGSLTRSSEVDTPLPTLGVVAAQVLESTLDLSAEPKTEAYIKDTGSTIPAAAIDINSEAIATIPMRFSIQDDAKPLVVRARPDQKLTADVAVLIYDIGGQPLLAQFLALNTEAAFSDLRFHLRNDGYSEVIPYATRNNVEIELQAEGRDYTIPQPDREHKSVPTVLVIPHYIPPDGQQVLPLSVPDFDGTLSITSHVVFDLRSESARIGTAVLPDWLRTAVQASDLTEESTGLTVTDYDFDRVNRRFRMELFQESPAELVNAKRVISSAVLHSVSVYGDDVAVGRSDFLVFSNEAGATIPIEIPVGTTLVGMTLNQQSRGDAVRSGSIDAVAPARLSHLALQWTTSAAVSDNSSVLSLPRLRGVDTIPLVLIKPPPTPAIYWSVDAPVLAHPQFSRAVADSLTRTLRTVNPAFRFKPSSEDPAAAVMMTDSFWQQLTAESPTAATSFRAALEEFGQCSKISTVRLSSAPSAISIRTLKTPSVLYSAAFLLSLVTMLVCVVVDRRRRSVEPRGAAKTKTLAGQSTTTAAAADSPE